jgi:parvulin-like peptidyl-prolyl isomerase
MADPFDFSVPGSPALPQRSGRGLTALVGLVVALQVALLAAVWYGQRGGGSRQETAGAVLGVDARRELALKLEKQGLTESAVAAWQEYLALKGGEKDKAAEIWYRIGTLWQDAGEYDKALAAYYTAESFGRLPNLENEIGRRVQESLDALGKYAALRYELKARTTVGGGEANAGDEVVAEIGPRKITRADLDRLIEAQITDQLERFGRALPPEQREQRKAELMKQFSDNRLRFQVLGQYLTEEVLCRKAREDRLTDQPAVRSRLQQAERSILAAERMAREIAAKVQITPGDVKTYYEANKQEFRTPERARVAHIQVADEERAAALVASLGEGQPFEELAKTLSQDSASASRGGVLSGFVLAGRDEAPGLGRLEGLAAAVFGAAAGSVVPQPLRSAKGWHVLKVVERLPESLPAFEEAQQDAYQRLNGAKEREVQEALIRELYQAYDVTMNQRALGIAEQPADASQAPTAPSAKP